MLTLAPGRRLHPRALQPHHGRRDLGAPVERFFEYVTPESEARYAPHLERSLRFSYDLRRQLSNVRSARAAGRTATDLVAFTRLRLAKARPLVKDPIAVFSAGWLADRFGMDVVVTIRHPAAFVASFTRLGYRHDFNSFLAEPQLLVDYLGPFEGEIRRYAEEPGDPIDEAVLLWRLVYATVDRYRAERPGWIFVRHEDLSLDPARGLRRRCTRRSASSTRTRCRMRSAHTPGGEPGPARGEARGPARQPREPERLEAGAERGAGRPHPRRRGGRVARVLRRRGLVALHVPEAAEGAARRPRGALAPSRCSRRASGRGVDGGRTAASAMPSASPSSSKKSNTRRAVAGGSEQRSSKRTRR